MRPLAMPHTLPKLKVVRRFVTFCRDQRPAASAIFAYYIAIISTSQEYEGSFSFNSRRDVSTLR